MNDELKRKMEIIEERLDDIVEFFAFFCKVSNSGGKEIYNNDYSYLPRFIRKEIDSKGLPEVKFNKTDAIIWKNGQEIFRVDDLSYSIEIFTNNRYLLKIHIKGEVLKEEDINFFFNIYSNLTEPIINYKSMNSRLFKNTITKGDKVSKSSGGLICAYDEKVLINIVEDITGLELM